MTDDLMAPAARFLAAFTQALSTISLYPDGHPSHEGVVDAAYEQLRAVQAIDRHATFSFLGDDIVVGQRPLRELRRWDWGQRLANAGIQRLQFEADVSREDFENFLSEVLARLTLQAALSQGGGPAPQSSGPIRFGEVGIRELESEPAMPTATLELSLREEADTIGWLHGEMMEGRSLPLAEAEAVVRSLAAAMHGDQAVVLPLLALRRYDEYTTTHSLNVCVLAMGLAEWLGLGARDVRAFGTAGLLHDIGKTRLPLDLLNKPGAFTPEERAIMNTHPVEGARIIIATEDRLDLAAVVAYEHHVREDGGGYPVFEYPRATHQASKLVHVCDVYDALRTNRPYRAAWPAPQVLEYLAERSGAEFDRDVALAFVKMMSQWEPRSTPLAGGEGSAGAQR